MISPRRHSFHEKRNMHFVETISIASGAMQDGEQTREMICPQCGGGQSKEKSFCIRVFEGRVHYRCYRASCRLRGSLLRKGTLLEPTTAPQVRGVPSTYTRKYYGTLRPMPSDGYNLFESRFGLQPHDIDFAEILYAPESSRFSFPVFSPDWGRRGVSLRSFKEGVQKWDHYPQCDVKIPWMGWYIRPAVTYPESAVVVTEDPISSLKVSRQFISCYLNGTDVNVDKLYEIMRLGRRRGVVFALDPDASAKAVEIVREYSFYLGGTGRAVSCPKDPKYLSDKEIRELFK